jgi:DNA polymerase-4
LEKIGVRIVGDLRGRTLQELEARFGRHGVRMHELARGIDESPVLPDRPTQSVSSEDTFPEDVLLDHTEAMIVQLADKTWTASRKEIRVPRTVVLKLKTKEFRIITRSFTPTVPPSSCEELTRIALSLRARVDLDRRQLYRLVGVGLSNFSDPAEQQAQSTLFE